MQKSNWDHTKRTLFSFSLSFSMLMAITALSTPSGAAISHRAVVASNTAIASDPGVDLYLENDDGSVRVTLGDKNLLDKGNYPHAMYNGKMVYFVSLHTMEKVLGTANDVDSLVKSASIASSDIESCLANPAIGENSTATVQTNLHELCKLPDLYYGSPVKYQVTKQAGELVIGLKIFLNYQGQKRSQALDVIHSNTQCVIDFYADQGLHLDLQLVDDASAAKGDDLIVNLWDDYPRENAANWSAFAMDSIAYTQGGLCGTLVHEMGHLLGLEDDYHDPLCPDRPTVSTDQGDVMNYSWEFFLFPKHLTRNQTRQIIAPLCFPKF